MKYPKNLFIAYSEGKCTLNLNKVYMDLWTTSNVPLSHFIKNNILYNSLFYPYKTQRSSPFSYNDNDTDNDDNNKTEYFRKLYLIDNNNRLDLNFNEYGSITDYFNKNEIISKIKVYLNNDNKEQPIFYIGDQLLYYDKNNILYYKKKDAARVSISKFQIDLDNNVILFECLY